jgi:hypothetical protein
MTSNNRWRGREAWSVWRRGCLGTVCARVACPTWSCGPSTSPLERIREIPGALKTEIGKTGQLKR